MAIQAEVAGLGTLEFPDGTDPSVIRATVKKQILAKQGSQPQAPAAAPAEGGGVMDTLKDVGSQIARPIAKGVAAVPLMAMDAGVAARNIGGNAANKALGRPATPDYDMPSKMFEESLDSVTRKPKTAFGQGVEDVESMMVGGPASAEEKAAARLLGKAPTPREALMDSAHRDGFILPPSETGRSVGKAVQSMAGKAQVEKEASFKNAETADRLAKVALGMHPEDPLDATTLDRLRRPAYAAYEAVASTGSMKADDQYINDVIGAGKRFTKSAEDFPGSVHPDIDKLKATYLQDNFTARGAIDAMKQLRADASKNLKNYDPEKNAIGLVQRELSDALLSRLDRQAAASKDPTLITRFKEARTQLAKIQTVEDAMTGTRVSARELAKMLNNGKPLTGELKQIAQAANEFPKAFQDVSKLGESGPWSVVDFLTGAIGAGGAAGAASGGHLAGGSAAALTAVAARPAARAALRSKAYQRSSTRPKLPSTGAIRRQTPQAIAALGTDLGDQQ